MLGTLSILAPKESIIESSANFLFKSQHNWAIIEFQSSSSPFFFTLQSIGGVLENLFEQGQMDTNMHGRGILLWTTGPTKENNLIGFSTLLIFPLKLSVYFSRL